MFILSIVLSVIAFIVLGFVGASLKCNDKAWCFTKLQYISLPILLLMIFSFFSYIPANNVGILYSPFSGTSENVLSEGFHAKGPFDKVYKFSTEVQTVSITGITSQTKDSQYVSSNIDVKFRVSENNAFIIFKQYHSLNNVSNSLIMPTTQRTLELITTKYNVIDILGESRAEIYTSLESDLTATLKEYGIEFYSISIIDMDAGDEIENAITAEAVAKKSAEIAKQELIKTETEAQKLAVQAQAEQDAAKIEAETLVIQAEAEKQANELKNTSLTDSILMQLWIEKWDGQVPTYYGGDGADLIFNTGTASLSGSASTGSAAN